MKKAAHQKNKKSSIFIGLESDDDKSDEEDLTKRKITALVMWYLLVIDLLKRLFSNPRGVTLMRWYSEQRSKNDEHIRHPMDGTHWKNFDLQYPGFMEEIRNVRFALATDGMNPFGIKGAYTARGL